MWRTNLGETGESGNFEVRYFLYGRESMISRDRIIFKRVFLCHISRQVRVGTHTGIASITKSASESILISVVPFSRARAASASDFDIRCFATSFSSSLSVV